MGQTLISGQEREGKNQSNPGIGTATPGNLLTVQQTSATDPIAGALDTVGKDAKSLDYARLTAVLTEAVKELKKENGGKR